MALDPKDRYESPRELADDIDRWKADEPITALREPLWHRIGRWTRRRRTIVSAALAASMVATLALGVVLAVQARANHELRRANEVAKRINQALLEANRRVAKTNDELQTANLRERNRFDLALDAIRIFHAGVSDEPLLREVEFAGLRSHLLRGAIEFYRKLESRIADLEATLGTGPEILAARRKAVELRRSLAADSPDDPTARAEVASSLISFGIIVRTLESEAAGRKHLEEARSILEELNRVEPANRQFLALLAQSEQEIGQSSARLKQYPDALAAYDRALRIQQKLAAEEPSSVAFKDSLATLMKQKGVLQIFMSRYPEAQQTLGQAREILEQLVLGEPGNSRFQLELSNVLKDLGDLLNWSGKLLEALKLHRRALAIRESLSESLPTAVGYRLAIAHSLLAIGQLDDRTGRKSQAIEAYRRSAALQDRRPESPIILYNLGCTRTYLARCLDGPERLAEADRAARVFRRAIAAGFGGLGSIGAVARAHPELKSSPEFRLLLLDLDFPEQPFVGAGSSSSTFNPP
jgi:tetratricopeptide (TPR) repeat protein